MMLAGSISVFAQIYHDRLWAHFGQRRQMCINKHGLSIYFMYFLQQSAEAFRFKPRAFQRLLVDDPGIPEAKVDPVTRLQCDFGLQDRTTSGHEVHNSIKPLKKPYDGVCHLCQCKLLSDADSRAAVEGNICPRRRLPFVPSVRSEVEMMELGIISRWIEVFSSLHGEGTICYRRVFQDANGGLSIGPAASGQRCIMKCESNVERHHRIQPESLIHSILCNDSLD